jgi:hypothetical protein
MISLMPVRHRRTTPSWLHAAAAEKGVEAVR